MLGDRFSHITLLDMVLKKIFFLIYLSNLNIIMRKIDPQWFARLDKFKTEGKNIPADWDGYMDYGDENKIKLIKVASSYVNGYDHVKQTTILHLPFEEKPSPPTP